MKRTMMRIHARGFWTEKNDWIIAGKEVLVFESILNAGEEGSDLGSMRKEKKVKRCRIVDFPMILKRKLWWVFAGESITFWVV